MNNNPIVSVLMTSYNREKYIAFAIESVLSSTLTNFELIIVDDCSADETVNIARKYAAGDSRIKVFINEQNIGDYPNRNKAAALATGKYLKYVDSDDYIYPDGLEIMVNSMERFPEAGLGLCSLKPDSKNPFPFILHPMQAYEYHFFGPGLFHYGPLTAIFLKTAFDLMGGFPTGRMISDSIMWHEMALRYPIVLMQDGIVWQRRHPEQELSDQDKFTFEGEKIKWKYLKSDKCLFLQSQLNTIKKKCLKAYVLFILSGIKRFNYHNVKLYSKCFWYVLSVNTKK